MTPRPRSTMVSLVCALAVACSLEDEESSMTAVDPADEAFRSATLECSDDEVAEAVVKECRYESHIRPDYETFTVAAALANCEASPTPGEKWQIWCDYSVLAPQAPMLRLCEWTTKEELVPIECNDWGVAACTPPSDIELDFGPMRYTFAVAADDAICEKSHQRRARAQARCNELLSPEIKQEILCGLTAHCADKTMAPQLIDTSCCVESPLETTSTGDPTPAPDDAVEPPAAEPTTVDPQVMTPPVVHDFDDTMQLAGGLAPLNAVEGELLVEERGGVATAMPTAQLDPALMRRVQRERERLDRQERRRAARDAKPTASR